MPAAAAKTRGRLPVDLTIFGPGPGEPLNIQRKIIKHGEYKNWRLDGELIYEPEGDPRFRLLARGDIAVFDFDHALPPAWLRLFLFASARSEDRPFMAAFAALLGERSMVVAPRASVEDALRSLAPATEHPVHDLLVDTLLDSAWVGAATPDAPRSRRRPAQRIPRETILAARDRADAIGQEGEAVVNAWLGGEKAAGRIRDFDWVAERNAVSPFDFTVVTADGAEERWEAKSTTGPFERPFHVSAAELLAMATEDIPYRVVRVYRLGDEAGTEVRVSGPVGDLARLLMGVFDGLPRGTGIDGIVVTPTSVDAWSDPVRLAKQPEAHQPGPPTHRPTAE